MSYSDMHTSYSNTHMSYSNMHMSYSNMNMSYNDCVLRVFYNKYAYNTRIVYNTRILKYEGVLRAYHESMSESDRCVHHVLRHVERMIFVLY